MWKLVGTGSRRGVSPASRAGDVLRQPLVWAAFATALSLTGPRGRRAALRGAACAGVAVAAHLPIKRVIGRRRPRGAALMGLGPLTSSFPSGHTATDLGFMFGASQELPVLVVPLSAATLMSHWSLIRSRKHYPSDVIAGGAVAVLVTAAAWKLRPPGGRPRHPHATSPRTPGLRNVVAKRQAGRAMHAAPHLAGGALPKAKGGERPGIP